MTHLPLSTILLLSFIAFCANFLDAIAGGGGLLMLPSLLLAGLDPFTALAVNKFQSSTGSVSATLLFAKKQLIEWRKTAFMALAALASGAIGALCVSLLDAHILQILVPILLILVAIYFLFSSKLSHQNVQAKLSHIHFLAFIVPLIGFYDGIFGPGTGSFFMLAFVLLLGFGIIGAVAHTKLLNASSNLGALLIFMIKGAVVFSIALPMACGALIGGQLGARCAVKFGAHLIKPLLILVSVIMAVKLLMNPQNPLHVLLLSFY